MPQSRYNMNTRSTDSNNEIEIAAGTTMLRYTAFQDDSLRTSEATNVQKTHHECQHDSKSAFPDSISFFGTSCKYGSPSDSCHYDWETMRMHSQTHDCQ